MKVEGRNSSLLTPIAIALTLACSATVRAQVADTISYSYQSVGLENDSLNIIQNIAFLDNFYSRLYALKKQQDTVINIVHLGDSHIQADFMTAMVRRRLHEHFGNAGRGLIFPGKIAGTNEPFNFVSASSATWTARRIVQPQPTLPIGIAGITIRTTQADAKVSIAMRDLWLDYTFEKIGLFAENSDSAYHVQLRDTVGFISDNGKAIRKDYLEFLLRHPAERITVEIQKQNSLQNHFTLFGIRLFKHRPGVQYHAIGVNGAKYEQYKSASQLLEQMTALTPALIIVSLGTNESLASPALDKNFLQHVDSLVHQLTSMNPDAQIILTTPQECFRKKTRINPGSLAIRNQIIQYAVENGFAFWDCYAAMGGSGSAIKWRRAGLFRPDGVHLTIQGYEYQGELFFSALMKGYNQYVSVQRR